MRLAGAKVPPFFTFPNFSAKFFQVFSQLYPNRLVTFTLETEVFFTDPAAAMPALAGSVETGPDVRIDAGAFFRFLYIGGRAISGKSGFLVPGGGAPHAGSLREAAGCSLYNSMVFVSAWDA